MSAADVRAVSSSLSRPSTKENLWSFVPLSKRPSTPPVVTTTSPKDIIPAVSPTNSVTTTVQVLEVVPTSSSPTTENEKRKFTSQLVSLLDDDSFEFLTWMPDGMAFTILKPKIFTKEYMPKYFNIRNMSSFVRKLTRSGFSRVHEPTTMNSDIFKHPQFRRGTKCNHQEDKFQTIDQKDQEMNKGMPLTITDPKNTIQSSANRSKDVTPTLLIPHFSTSNVLPTVMDGRFMAMKPPPFHLLPPPPPLAVHRFGLEQKLLQSHCHSWMTARPTN